MGLSLALATLVHEWRRYMAAVIALAFSGLLVLAQVGVFMGIGKAFTATIDRSPADIMVMAPRTENLLSDNSGLPRRVKPTLYLHPEVIGVDELAGGGGRLQNNPGPGKKRKESQVQIMAIDPFPGSLNMPVDFTEATRIALNEPFVVAVDRTALKTLGVRLGDHASLNGRTVRIGAVLDGYPNMMNSTMVMSRQTQRALGMANRNARSGALLVRLRDPARAEIVRNELNASSQGAYRAWTRAELAKANETAMLQEQIIGVLLVFSVVLGIFIGVGITSQTLRGAILASVKEFASLRALGVSMGSLRMIVLELSFWIGVVGLGVTAALVAGVNLLATANGLPMAFPLGMVVMTAILLLAIAMISGGLALGVLKKSQPADLLR